ncbi:methyltransferase domain-containing protein [Tumebacillus sp. ITR2]|uniref:Methyltransferase domain-containing protein n=1 Tax=Tumebacillus amylolyticus TaxID=2801339 RepID=A0ABS1JFS4_9BACL|nr:methyltransferase domain-containing protein [Tumebacillus amylolyticus]MBL0389139.1 methyltransferase domain-containing protein [Tumebacillus amylolyticus]
MSTSKAAMLQAAVLKIASQSGSGLDLAQVSGQKAVVEKLPEGTIKEGERVLVVGATESIAFSAASQIGAEGFLLLLEEEKEKLTPIRESLGTLEAQIGYANWALEVTELDDYQTNSAYLADYLSEHPVQEAAGYRDLQEALREQREQAPFVASESIDVVILDTVTNRLKHDRVRAAIAEAFRVLRRGGRVVLLSLLADESGLPLDLPALPNGPRMQNVPLETEIVALLDEAGFYGMRYPWRAELPTQVVQGIELRSFVVQAYKGKQGVCLDQGHAVMYRGPWKEVLDDDGHRYVRGERVAVCEKTYGILMREPYQDQLIGLPCYQPVPLGQAPLFDCNTPQLRDPHVTKGKKSVFEQGSGGDCCAPSTDGGGCC